MLAQEFHSLMDRAWEPVFGQARTRRRAIEHAMALGCTLGRRTISRTICALDRADKDWSADYKIFSRSKWEAASLFDPVIEEYLVRYPQGYIRIAFDDTAVGKTGKKIKSAFWQRDHMSPQFRVNFLWGLRFVQASMLFGHWKEGNFSARAVPVGFQEAPAVKKPGKRASEEQMKQYRAARKEQNLSTQTLEMLRGLRVRLDQKGAAGRILLGAFDGAFCNRSFFKAQLDRTELIARCRNDARLCFEAEQGSRRKYDQHLFTPQQVREDKSRTFQRIKVHFGGKRRRVRCKEVRDVLWRRGAGKKRLRLIVIAPVPYKLSRHSRTNYRQPAYLLTTDLRCGLKPLLQAYFDRWQIEVNHRDEKTLFGVGQAQVRSNLSVPRHPAFAVASYSMLLLAALRCFGPGRTSDYLDLPKWRKKSNRASCLDLLSLLRSDLNNETPVSAFVSENLAKRLMLSADT